VVDVAEGVVLSLLAHNRRLLANSKDPIVESLQSWTMADCNVPKPGATDRTPIAFSCDDMARPNGASGSYVMPSSLQMLYNLNSISPLTADVLRRQINKQT
jgi:hypothetical protein